MEPTKKKNRTRLARRRSLNPRQQYKLGLRLRLELQFMLLFNERPIHTLKRQSSKSQQLKVFRQGRLFLSMNVSVKPEAKVRAILQEKAESDKTGKMNQNGVEEKKDAGRHAKANASNADTDPKKNPHHKCQEQRKD